MPPFGTQRGEASLPADAPAPSAAGPNSAASSSAGQGASCAPLAPALSSAFAAAPPAPAPALSSAFAAAPTTLAPPASPAPMVARVAAGMALAGIGLLFAMILISAMPALWQADGGSVFTWTWRPYQGQFGILPMIGGSLLLAGSALVLGWPMALGVCCWMLAQPPGGSVALAPVRACVRLMAAVPTVVYGFAAVFLVTPLVRGSLGGSGFCWLAAALVLALLALPTMVLVLESALAPRLEGLCPGALAVGLSRMELLYFFVLPASRNGLLAAALLGAGRALGDTLLPLMLAGNAPELPGGLGDSLRSLTAHMALVTANEVGGAAYNSLFAAGAILLAVTAAVSLTLRRLRHTQQGGDAGLYAAPLPHMRGKA